jgi:hypothetical protein
MSAKTSIGHILANILTGLNILPLTPYWLGFLAPATRLSDALRASYVLFALKRTTESILWNTSRAGYAARLCIFAFIFCQLRVG